jgi:hypothetical protein
MAQSNAPYGLKPVRHLTGGVIRPSEAFSIASGYGTALAVGDLVAKSGTGTNIIVGVNGVAGAIAIGVFAGCKYTDTLGNIYYRTIWPAGQVTQNAVDATAFVYDDPNIVYKVRASAGFALADVGQFAGYTVGSPNTTLGFSQGKLDSADITGTLDNLKIINLLQTVGNAYGSFAEAEVLISFHEYNQAGSKAS